MRSATEHAEGILAMVGPLNRAIQAAEDDGFRVKARWRAHHPDGEGRGRSRERGNEGEGHGARRYRSGWPLRAGTRGSNLVRAVRKERKHPGQAAKP